MTRKILRPSVALRRWGTTTRHLRRGAAATQSNGTANRRAVVLLLAGLVVEVLAVARLT